jgi:hypothetical protein
MASSTYKNINTEISTTFDLSHGAIDEKLLFHRRLIVKAASSFMYLKDKQLSVSDS